MIEKREEKQTTRQAAVTKMVEVVSKPQLQAMVSVPKRNHKRAVKRNLLKRRMREAYRLNKSNLMTAVTAGDNNLHVSFTYIAKEELEYEVIEKAIKKSLERIITKIGDCTTGAAD